MKALYDALEKVEVCKTKARIDDKISVITKALIQERGCLKRMGQKSVRERTELAELNKTIRREVRQDIKKNEKRSRRALIPTPKCKKQKRPIAIRQRGYCPKSY